MSYVTSLLANSIKTLRNWSKKINEAENHYLVEVFCFIKDYIKKIIKKTHYHNRILFTRNSQYFDKTKSIIIISRHWTRFKHPKNQLMNEHNHTLENCKKLKKIFKLFITSLEFFLNNQIQNILKALQNTIT